MKAESVQIEFEERLRLLPKHRRSEIDHAIAALPEGAAVLARWIYANSPLSDCVNYAPALFCGMACHGAFLLETMPELQKLPEYLFLNYVLHPRVNEEVLCDCRTFFHAQLRERTAGLSAREAALEINYWNAAQVRYQATDLQTRSALQVYRSGRGRCGEESVFAVNVLRAMGIPARQVYVPRWSHCDDNHAWVEVWCDEKWNYLGACEPEEVLNRGWFTNAASRAMLVHSRCFGRPEGEDVICKQGAVTYLNQTARYADPTDIHVKICDAEDSPVCGAQVEFCVLNAGQWYPIAVTTADEAGNAGLTCGRGSLMVRASCGAFSAERLINTAADTFLSLRLSPLKQAEPWRSFLFVPPTETQDRGERPTEEQLFRNRERKKTADAAREKRLSLLFDEGRAVRLEKCCGSAVRYILKESYGNFSTLCTFLEEAKTDTERVRRVRLLQTLSPKDWSCVGMDVLLDALLLPESGKASGPRVGHEPLSCFCAAVQEWYSAAQRAEFRADPRKLYRWIRKNLRALPQQEYACLFTLPAAALAGGYAEPVSQELLFVAACRALGIGARRNPFDGRPEFEQNGVFLPVEEAGRGTLVLQRAPGEEWTPDADFGMMLLSGGAWKPVDLSVAKWQNQSMTLPLYAGTYRILTSLRLPNGCQHGSELLLSLSAGETKTVLLHRENVDFSEQAVDFSVPDVLFLNACGAKHRLSELTAKPSIFIWPEAGGEPTEHLLNEILTQKDAIASASVYVFVRSWAEAENEKLRTALPGASILLDRDGEMAQLLARKTYVDPDAMPLLLVTDRPLHVVSAAAGYRVGSVGLALRIYKSATLC